MFCFTLFQQTMKLLVVCAVLFTSLYIPTHADDSNEESDTEQTIEEATSPPEEPDSTDPPQNPEEVDPESDAEPTQAPDNLELEVTEAPEDLEPEATEAPEDVESEATKMPEDLEPEATEAPKDLVPEATEAPINVEPETLADPIPVPENIEPKTSVDSTPAPGNLEQETQAEVSIAASTSGTAFGNQYPVETEAYHSENNQASSNILARGFDQSSQYLEKSVSPDVVESMVDASISAGVPISRDTMYRDMSQQNAAVSFSASSGYEPSAEVAAPSVSTGAMTPSFSAPSVSSGDMASALSAPSQPVVPEAEPVVKIEVSASEVLSSGIPVGPAEDPVVDAATAAQSATGSVRYQTQANYNSGPSIEAVSPPSGPELSAPSAPVVESATKTVSAAQEAPSNVVVSEPSGTSYSSMADFLTGQRSKGSATGPSNSVTKLPVTTPIPSIPEPPKVTLPRKPQQTSTVNTVSRITKKVNRIINFHRQKFTFYKCQTSCLVESIRCMRSCRTNTTFVLYKDDYLKCGKKCRVRQYHCKNLCKTELTRERTDQLRLIRTQRRQ